MTESTLARERAAKRAKDESRRLERARAACKALPKPTARIHQGRARVIVIGCLKGGVGKSTSAILLAMAYVIAYGARVLVVDADPKSQTAFGWSERAEDVDKTPLPFDVESYPSPIMSGPFEKKGWFADYDLIIVDTGGDDDRIFMAACELADHVMMTVSPSRCDLELLPRTAMAAQKAIASTGDKPVSLLMTQCIPGSTETIKARDMLAEAGVYAMSVTVPLLLWYRDAYGRYPLYEGQGTKAYMRVQYELDNPDQPHHDVTEPEGYGDGDA